MHYTWYEAVDNSTILPFIYGWNANAQNYIFIDVLTPGIGYWLYANDDCDLIISSNYSSRDEYITDIAVGWNLFGIPDNSSIAKENLTIVHNATSYTWSEAVNNGTILPFIYGWNANAQTYLFVDVLHPGEGYWLYANDECILKK
jgi:hypothetical protein